MRHSKVKYDYHQVIQTLSSSLNSLKDLSDMSHLIVSTMKHTLNLAGSCLFIKTQSGSFEVSASEGSFTNKKKQTELMALISERRREIEFPNLASEIWPGLAFLIPLITMENEIGILCLSPKISGETFSSDDIYLLHSTASIAAMSLNSAILIRDLTIRDNFISVASHELRSHLTSILGYTELLLSRNPTEEKRKLWLEHISRNGRIVASMVDNLLNISRIQYGRVNIEKEEVQVVDVLKESLAFFRDNTANHEFVLDIQDNLPPIWVDRDKFTQVISNLVDNAVKYSPAGGKITLTGEKSRDENQVLVKISDEGIGIDTLDQESLFSIFHRIIRPETKDIRGSGLGLYIAKNWLENMGGKIWLSSKLNAGSTFYVSVPTKVSE